MTQSFCVFTMQIERETPEWEDNEISYVQGYLDVSVIEAIVPECSQCSRIYMKTGGYWIVKGKPADLIAYACRASSIGGKFTVTHTPPKG